mgnify:CR=1 FL=1
MRWETRAQGVKKDRAGLAQPVAVCEMSVQHLRGAGTVCKMTMQRLHGLFTVCKMSVQHLHSPFTVCKMTVQHLHSPFTVCGGTMQHLHSPFTVCETIMQHLHSPFTVCETIMQHLHSLVAVCAPPTCTRPNSPASADAPPDHSAPYGPVWRANAIRPYPGTIIRPYMYPANLAGIPDAPGQIRRRPQTPIPDAP